MPKVQWIRQSDASWSRHFGGVDDCLSVIDDGGETEAGAAKHDYSFYLNEDNRALRFEIGSNKLAAAAIKKQFEVAITLVGLAILHDADLSSGKSKGDDESENAQDGVEAGGGPSGERDTRARPHYAAADQHPLRPWPVPGGRER